MLCHLQISLGGVKLHYGLHVSFCRILPSVGDSSGGPGGSLAHWCGDGSRHHLPHLETGKERKQSWWVECNFPLNICSSSCESSF